jgi:Ca-activated chloride channel family protein
MNTRLFFRLRLILAGLVLLLFTLRAGAEAEAQAADQTLSPYFFVQSDDPTLDRLPLKSTEVEATVVGVIAQVTVMQTYRNEGTRPIEARYVFPGSTRAAVHGLTLHVGDRTIEAQIREKAKAQAEYRQARQEGKRAALLEQHRPNVFQMHVANIDPGDEVKVELRYTELLVPTDGAYRWVYPTVVGPRYVGQSESAEKPAGIWAALPYLHQGEPAPAAFRLKATLRSAIPFETVASRSHDIEVNHPDAGHAEVRLAETGQSEANRDFILDYRLTARRIESGVLLYPGQGQDENFFLAMIEPPRKIGSRQIPPREYVFVVDVSGSMNGFPLDTAKTLLRKLVGSLRPEDSFNLLLFAGTSNLLAERSLPATPDNLARAIDLLERQEGSGGTELLPALRRTLALPRDEPRARSIVVVTDGYVSIEAEAFDLVRSSLGQANLFAFGIGSSVNRFLIEGLARAGQGEPFIVTRPDEAAEEAERFRHYIGAPLLSHIGVSFEGFDAYDVEPLQLPDLLASRPLILFGKWKGQPAGRLKIKGITGDGYYDRSLDLAQAAASPDHAALKYLWARHRIATLSDYNQIQSDPRRVEEVTRLGLAYNLLTAYTAFVAVDQVARQGPVGSPVDQPLPLPAGVSDLAVGSVVPSSPEPETWLLMASAGLAGAWARWRQRRHG